MQLSDLSFNIRGVWSFPPLTGLHHVGVTGYDWQGNLQLGNQTNTLPCDSTGNALTSSLLYRLLFRQQTFGVDGRLL